MIVCVALVLLGLFGFASGWYAHEARTASVPAVTLEALNEARALAHDRLVETLELRQRIFAVLPDPAGLAQWNKPELREALRATRAIVLNRPPKPAAPPDNPSNRLTGPS